MMLPGRPTVYIEGYSKAAQKAQYQALDHLKSAWLRMRCWMTVSIIYNFITSLYDIVHMLYSRLGCVCQHLIDNMLANRKFTSTLIIVRLSTAWCFITHIFGSRTGGALVNDLISNYTWSLTMKQLTWLRLDACQQWLDLYAHQWDSKNADSCPGLWRVTRLWLVCNLNSCRSISSVGSRLLTGLC